jgi:hypothetical protein
VREWLTDDPNLGDRPGPNLPETELFAAEGRAALDRALSRLPARHRQRRDPARIRTNTDY